MHLESVGEIIKKIDKNLPDFLNDNAPNIPWKPIKGMRDHIAHRYFDIDADIIFDVVTSEIKPLLDEIRKLIALKNNKF